MNDFAIVRVSVLDLDNMFVSIRILMGGRGKGQIQKLSTGQGLLHKIETNPLLRKVKQCCNCISLYDVNRCVFGYGGHVVALRLNRDTVQLDG